MSHSSLALIEQFAVPKQIDACALVSQIEDLSPQLEELHRNFVRERVGQLYRDCVDFGDLIAHLEEMSKKEISKTISSTSSRSSRVESLIGLEPDPSVKKKIRDRVVIENLSKLSLVAAGGSLVACLHMLIGIRNPTFLAGAAIAFIGSLALIIGLVTRNKCDSLIAEDLIRNNAQFSAFLKEYHLTHILESSVEHAFCFFLKLQKIQRELVTLQKMTEELTNEPGLKNMQLIERGVAVFDPELRLQLPGRDLLKQMKGDLFRLYQGFSFWN